MPSRESPPVTAGTPATTLPAYIARGGEQELVAPCGLAGSQFYVFLLRGDKQKMQALADRLFNVPSGGAVRYEAFWDHVAVMFTHVDRLSSADPAQGWAAYGDIALWVPLIDRRAGGLVPRFVMYPAYMIVDNGATMATGREVYGFPKEMGWFHEPQRPEYLGDLTADVLGYARGSATRETVRTRLWSIQRRGGDAPAVRAVDDVKSLLHEIERGLKEIATDLAAEALILFNLLRDGLATPALGLKQIRDIADPGRAAFQSIVEAPLGMHRFHAASILGDDFTFTLEDLATHPVADDVGLAVGPQDVSFAFWLYADFVLGAGRTNWQGVPG
jgi:hypothetical protein